MARRLATPADASAVLPGPRPSLSALGSLGMLVVVAAVAGATAQAGLWWVPFAAGVAAGVASLRRRRVVLVVSSGAVVGWGLVLWIMALRGLPAGATARAIAAFAGLPPHAFVTVVATLLLAAVQALAGAWLARAVAALQSRLNSPGRSRRLGVSNGWWTRVAPCGMAGYRTPPAR